MKYQLMSILFSFSLACLLSCNPDCENYARVSAEVIPRFNLPGKPVLVRTNPIEFLKNRELYIEKLVGEEIKVDENTRVSSEYLEADGGRLVTLDETLDRGTVNFYVRDNDCGGFIPLSTTFNCQAVAGVSAEIRPKVRLPGDEVLVATTPRNFLKDRDLFFQKMVNGQLLISDATKLPAIYREDLGGSIVTLPMDAEGVKNFYIKNEECGGFIALNNPINVVNEDFISNNLSQFVSPTPAQIIIPIVPTVSPTNLVNTWFSPNNRDYCIWIVPKFLAKLDTKGDTICYQEQERLKPGDVVVGSGKQNSGSWELKAWCDFPRSFLFDANPITGGIIDTLTGYVTFTIDRTAKGLGIETYEGSLMTPESVIPEYRLTGVCGAGEPSGLINAQNRVAKTMMVVTSKETGRQLVLYRFDVVGLGFHGKPFCKEE